MPFSSSSDLTAGSVDDVAGTPLHVGGRTQDSIVAAQMEAVAAARADESNLVAARQQAIAEGMRIHRERREEAEKVRLAAYRERQRQQAKAQSTLCSIVVALMIGALSYMAFTALHQRRLALDESGNAAM